MASPPDLAGTFVHAGTLNFEGGDRYNYYDCVLKFWRNLQFRNVVVFSRDIQFRNSAIELPSAIRQPNYHSANCVIAELWTKIRNAHL